MQLSSDDGMSRLELDVCDLELQAPRPVLALFVRVRIAGYAGELKAWVGIDSLRRFAMELEALELVPLGVAVLDGATPEELKLTVLSPGSDVSCVTHVAMLSRQKVGARDYDTTLAGAFTLPAGAIRHAATTLRRWTDAKFLADLESWGFDEKALLDD